MSSTTSTSSFVANLDLHHLSLPSLSPSPHDVFFLLFFFFLLLSYTTLAGGGDSVEFEKYTGTLSFATTSSFLVFFFLIFLYLSASLSFSLAVVVAVVPFFLIFPFL